VLPFENMSGDPEQEYFRGWMVEEIITALSRFKWLFVIARNSSFHLQGQSGRCEGGRDAGLAFAMSLRGLCARQREKFASQAVD
jgi:adenylate cyclase